VSAQKRSEHFQEGINHFLSMESRRISYDVQPYPFTDYAFPAPGVYSNYLILWTFTVQSHFSASQFLRFHCAHANALKTFCVLIEREDFDLLKRNWMVHIPFLCCCCAVLHIDMAIQYYTHSMYLYNVFSLLCMLCSQLSQFVRPRFPVIRGNLGPVHVEISQFYCIFWRTSHPTALLD